MSERKGLTLPSTPFSAGNSDTMPSSTAPCCTSSAVLSDPAQSLKGRAAERPRTQDDKRLTAQITGLSKFSRCCTVLKVQGCMGARDGEVT